MKSIYKPSESDANRCLAIRKNGKLGRYVPKDDSKHCLKMANKYPEWYKATESIIFNETIPFGSDVHMGVNQSALDAMIVHPSTPDLNGGK